jgi:hypothetical protein
MPTSEEFRENYYCPAPSGKGDRKELTFTVAGGVKVYVPIEHRTLEEQLIKGNSQMCEQRQGAKEGGGE